MKEKTEMILRIIIKTSILFLLLLIGIIIKDKVVQIGYDKQWEKDMIELSKLPHHGTTRSVHFDTTKKDTMNIIKEKNK
jgi:hypothetical protein